MKLGSLFDGSGGFPLAGSLCGIEPVWAAEIEPYPIAVTRSRFPNMKHLGDISKVNGADIEPVDVITFGSPCQDLSVAGKRAGLKHEDNGDEETTRSGLFMEAVRIIREMREATHGVYPRFALWENVPGAFSSNKGEDFRVVLEEIVKIVEPTAVMPTVPKAGWAYADHYCGDGWSVAYRTFDAQYWGVPQRRRRIYLVADFAGQCAGEVSFERDGLRGYFAEGRTPGESLAEDAERSLGTADSERNCVVFTQNQREEVRDLNGVCGTLSAECGMHQQNYVCESVPFTFQNTGAGWWNESPVGATLRTPCGGDSLLANVIVTKDQGPDAVGVDPHNSALTGDKAATIGVNCGTTTGRNGALIQEDKSATLATNNDQYLFQPVPGILLDDQGGQQISARTDGESPTLRAEMHGNIPAVMEPIAVATQQGGAEITENGVCPTITAAAGMSGNNQPWICYSAGFCPEQSAKTRGIGFEKEESPTLRAGVTPAVVVRTWDARGNGDGVICNTITGDHNNRVTDYTSCVCYAMQAFGKYQESDVGSAMKARDYKDATDLVVECAGVDCRNATEYPEKIGTLQAKANGGFSVNCNQIVRVRYIVRRLTPTECARLQGFTDGWGIPDRKDSFTPEEYQFWLEVRNTHAAINGKAVKSYTKDQMLKWYNKLHTDSSEYKMWGNGIALPTALYVMQGIEEALRG